MIGQTRFFTRPCSAPRTDCMKFQGSVAQALCCEKLLTHLNFVVTKTRFNGCIDNSGCSLQSFDSALQFLQDKLSSRQLCTERITEPFPLSWEQALSFLCVFWQRDVKFVWISFVWNSSTQPRGFWAINGLSRLLLSKLVLGDTTFSTEGPYPQT